MPVHFVQQTPSLVSVLDPILRHPELEGAPRSAGPSG